MNNPFKTDRSMYVLLVITRMTFMSTNCTSLCAAVAYACNSGEITAYERRLLWNYIQGNRPLDANVPYWYTPIHKNKRIDWLNTHILKQEEEMRKFKARKPNKVGAILLIIILGLLIGNTIRIYSVNWIYTLVLLAIGIFIIYEIARVLWYHYED